VRRVIAHVDMDAFYVSCELQKRPELIGQPVVVAGTGPRAVVTTASYEARKFGVFSATPAERARRLCPQATFIPPDFDHYRETSKRVMKVLREHIHRVEVVGLDEAYLDLSDIERPKAAARRVKAAVHDATGLVCSIGIGPNKLAVICTSGRRSRSTARIRRRGQCPGRAARPCARMRGYAVRTKRTNEPA
jgi:DNA polymerase-4